MCVRMMARAKIDAISATRVILRLVRDQSKYRMNEVLAECQKFRAKDRNDAVSLVRRGLTRMFQNRPADANLDFAAFRKLVPGDVVILDTLISAVNKALVEQKK